MGPGEYLLDAQANKRPRTVLFDMDGVLCDFVGGSLNLHGKSLPPQEIVWDFMTQVGFTGGGDPAFWKPLEDPDFWANLNPLEDGLAVFQIVAGVLPKERIGFLSSGLCPGSADGKRTWIAKHLPGWEKHLVLGTQKALVAAPCKILFDDHGPNVEGFAAAGGNAVLTPRPWNSRKSMTCPNGWFDSKQLADELLALAGS